MSRIVIRVGPAVPTGRVLEEWRLDIDPEVVRETKKYFLKSIVRAAIFGFFACFVLMATMAALGPEIVPRWVCVFAPLTMSVLGLAVLTPMPLKIEFELLEDGIRRKDKHEVLAWADASQFWVDDEVLHFERNARPFLSFPLPETSQRSRVLAHIEQNVPRTTPPVREVPETLSLGANAALLGTAWFNAVFASQLAAEMLAAQFPRPVYIAMGWAMLATAAAWMLISRTSHNSIDEKSVWARARQYGALSLYVSLPLSGLFILASLAGLPH